MAIKFTYSIKQFFSPIHNSFIGHILFSFVERMTGYMIEKIRFFKSLGYYPNLKNPRSFNEKILWKKIYDRNPLLPIITDKYRVRQYLKDVLGVKKANMILVPLFFVTENPETIPFDNLLQEYIIKPNHASGKLILAENIDNKKKYTVKDNQKMNILFDCKDSREKIIQICNRWLSESHGFYKHEWAYQNLRHKIIIENLLRDSAGKTPVDYKFEVFNGQCHNITVCYDRFIDLRTARYTPDWEYRNVLGDKKPAPYMKKPKNLKYMIELAELLGKPFDYVRVDLLLLDNRIYFGELTSYTASARAHYNPRSFDFELGEKWEIIPNYWK